MHRLCYHDTHLCFASQFAIAFGIIGSYFTCGSSVLFWICVLCVEDENEMQDEEPLPSFNVVADE